jgi:hypothetical protein
LNQSWNNQGLSPYPGINQGLSPYPGINQGLSPYPGINQGLSPYSGINQFYQPYCYATVSLPFYQGISSTLEQLKKFKKAREILVAFFQNKGVFSERQSHRLLSLPFDKA